MRIGSTEGVAEWADIVAEIFKKGLRSSLPLHQYQYGPNCVRDSLDLRAALAILAERGRARMGEDGRRRCVAINPALLDGLE